MKRIFIIAGEPSGDLHASNLVKCIKKENSSVDFRGWGGDFMELEGVKIKNHLKNLSFMGFLEVLLNLRQITLNFRICKKQLLAYQPDLIIMVDYPGFNLRMSKWAKNNGFRVVYYISPQIWAWKASRIKTIKANIDRMYCILPFEKDFYSKHGFDVHYMGHPLMDQITSFRNKPRALKFKKEKSILAILPGSRGQEIKRKLDIMLKAAVKYNEMDIYVAAAPNLDVHFFKPYQEHFPQVKFAFGQTYELLQESDIAIVTSGTATLETALFRVPQVVCYRSSFISYSIARLLVDIKFISLVNLIMNREIVKELIQNNCSVENIQGEIDLILQQRDYREKMISEYDELIAKIGEQGCSEKIAQDLIKQYM